MFNLLILTFCLLFSSLIHAGYPEGLSAYENNKEDVAIKQLLPLADKGDRDSQFIVGAIYLYGGTGVPQDLKKAKKYLFDAANSQHSEARLHYGKLLLHLKDCQGAKIWLGTAAREFQSANIILGELALFGRCGTKINYAEAKSYFDHGGKTGFYYYGYMYERGLGDLERNGEKAYTAYALCAKDYDNCTFRYAKMTLTGKYGDKDQYKLGVVGVGSDANKKSAIELLQSLKEKGHEESIKFLAGYK